jgi:hypothetical protein
MQQRLSGRDQATFSKQYWRFPICGLQCWLNICLRNLAERFVGPTFVSAISRTSLSARFSGMFFRKKDGSARPLGAQKAVFQYGIIEGSASRP